MMKNIIRQTQKLEYPEEVIDMISVFSGDERFRDEYNSLTDETKEGGVSMKLKSKWIYCYKKGFRGALVSKNYHLIDDKLYFVLTYGEFPWYSLILELNLMTQECKTLFEVKHIVRGLICKDDCIFFTAMNGFVYCIGIDGSLIWENQVKKDNASPELMLDGDNLYVSNFSTFCLNKNTGDIIWNNDVYHIKSYCNFLQNGNSIISAESGGKVFCLNKLTGEKIWDYGNEEWISRCVLMDNGNLLVNHSGGKFIILDPENGNLINTMNANGHLYCEPVFADGKMYIGDADDVINSQSGNMTCYEISGDSFRELFSYKVDGGISTEALINDNKLFFAAEDNYLYCIDKSTGEPLMHKKKTKGICRNIIIRNDELIIISDKGQVECFSVIQ